MPVKGIDLPPEVALAFVGDMRAFFRAKDQLKRDEIAARQCWALQQYQRPRDKKLRRRKRCHADEGSGLTPVAK